jgi:hypothetical protein
LLKDSGVELEQTGSPDVPVARDSLSNSVNMKRNMKTNIFIIGLLVSLMGQAMAQTEQPVPPAEVTTEISSDTLVTKLGTVYHNFRIEKVDPAGLTISYVPNGGGLGIVQVPFNLLPDDWQRRYGYAPERAANQPVFPAEVTNEISSDELVTKSGTVYHNFRIERVDPAGLTISYIPNGGGLGMEKIPFNLFPDDWQRRYGYDPEKAAEFDSEQKRAMAQLREQMIADEKAYREKRDQEEAAEEAAAAQAKIDAEAAQTAAEAAAAQATNAPAIEATNSPAITDTNQPASPSLPGGY